MAVCPNCRGNEIEFDGTQGNSVCTRCGTVVEENAVVAEVTFAELANGSSVLEGQFISADRGKTSLPTIFGRRVGDLGKSEGGVTESREMTLANGRRRIQALAGAVGLTGDHYIETAHRWYSLALQHQFTRGRKGPNVIAACLYIVCRQERTPHMLLDFADVLSTSVYNLGGTFLRLVRLLNLEMPIVDPSFFVARFAARLDFGDKTALVANSALRVVSRMKRDWIQTGRRPAGVCAAGLIIAARMHGFRRTEAEVVKVVRICEATLKKRLEEFGRTPSSMLTPQEFEGIWLEQEADPPSFSHTRPKPAEPNTVHILPMTLLQIQSNLRNRITEVAEEDEEMAAHTPASPEINLPLTPPDSQIVSPLASETNLAKDHLETTPEEGPTDSLSDIEWDEELNTVMLNPAEIDIKTRIWTEMNKDFLEKEAEKLKIKLLEATENSEKEPPLTADSTLAAITTTAVEVGEFLKPTKKRTRAPKSSSLIGEGGASSAAEAAKKVLQNKRFSKKINYEALDELFSSTEKSLTTGSR